jgi:aryl-alcohol dehydrogenase-like predicted oxidoreductase
MQYRLLGTTGIRVSVVSFGAGPVPALLTRPDAEDRQRTTIRRAIDAGINWFDTAATYGEGQSEKALGAALAELGANDVHLATKVRLAPEGLGDIRGQVFASVEASLARLRRPRVTLIQLHNSITARRGDLPTSVTPRDVLGQAGVLAAFESLRRNGFALHCGLTGLGDVAALREVIRSGGFQTVQTPYHLLNPSAGKPFAPTGVEADYGNLIGECAGRGMGVLAIRVFAGGALAGQPPSDHTRTTKFFPLAIYESDLRRAAALARELSPGTDIRELAIRFSLDHPGVSSALIGFSSSGQIDQAASAVAREPLGPELLSRLERWWQEHC